MAPAPRKRRWPWWLLVATAALGAGGGYAYHRRTAEKPVLIQVEKAGRRDLIETVAANGRIQPVLLVKISPEVSGEITALPVKEGQRVRKGDLLVKIRPDSYEAARRSAEAGFLSAQSNRRLAAANLAKAVADLKRSEELYTARLISEADIVGARTARDVALATEQAAQHQIDVASAALSRATEELAKTTIVAPIDGTVTKLNSQPGERVVGTAMMSGTEIMAVADLDVMEARVEIGEVDIVLIALGQRAWLDVDAFRDRRFSGVVTEIANSSRAALPGAGGGGGQSQEATKFEVRIRIQEKEAFRPGMTVTAEVETRTRTNVLAVPIQCVTTRASRPGLTNGSPATNGTPAAPAAATSRFGGTNQVRTATEIVFIRNGERVKATPITRGISDATHVEVLTGLTPGAEVVVGGYKAINRDLEDGRLVKLGEPEPAPNAAGPRP